jgi:hypothetical protein
MKGCALSKGDSLCYQKRIYIFPSPLFGFFYYFVFFHFLKSLKKNKIMLHYKGGMSVVSKHTSSKRKEHTNAHRKETCAGKGHLGKIPPWVKVLGRRGKVLQGLHIRNASKIQLRETWRRHLAKDAEMQMLLARHNETPFNVIFNDPREGKLGGFFTFRESEKMLNKTPLGYLFRK